MLIYFNTCVCTQPVQIANRVSPWATHATTCNEEEMLRIIITCCGMYLLNVGFGHLHISVKLEVGYSLTSDHDP